MANRVPADQPSSIPCPIAFIGEAPGAEENVKRRPLVGESGRLFNSALKTAGIERSECWVGNLFEHQAPGNDVAPWLADPSIFMPACARLMDEIEVANPTVLVPLGGSALKALTGIKKVSDVRGSPMLSCDGFGKRKIIATYHPAYILRQFHLLSVMVGDFIRAKREAEIGPEIRYPERRLILEPTLEDIKTFHIDAEDYGRLSVDIETGWGQITCIGFAYSPEVAICVPFVDLCKPNRSYWTTLHDEMCAWDYVRDLLEGPWKKIGQNYAAYDAFWLLEKHNIRTMNYTTDTRLLHHTLNPTLGGSGAKSNSLAFMAGCYSQQGRWKTWANHDEKRDA